jgi:hypothetical protein
MSLQRTASIAALIAATFVFVDSASSQPRAATQAPAAASAAGPMGMHGMTAKEREQHRKEMHDKMHGDKMHADKAGSDKDDDRCMGMMDKHKKVAQAQDGKGRADHARHDKTAAADGMGRGCGMGKKH